MSRSLKKGPYVDEKLLKKVLKAKSTGDRKAVKTWARRSTITPEMVGINLSVHNGKDFLNVFVEENMVGHKVGEFALTRKFIKHGGKMAKEEAAAASAGSSAAAPAAKASAPAAAKKDNK